MGGKKRAKQFFQKHRYSASKKCCEKNRRKEVRKTFLYLLEYHDQKMAEKKRAKQFFQKHRYSASKKCCEKIVGKKCKNVFYIDANIVTKK